MRSVCAAALVLVLGCTASKTAAPLPADALHGVASWYGQEYAGRTTANGEIFDPLQLTAAHRTLPFGTVVDVTNTRTRQKVRVRINDRGPYIGGRVVDLSYAAAQQISLVDPGSGEVDIAIVKMGRGEREPPSAYVVTVPELKPTQMSSAELANAVPVVVVDTVKVSEEHRGVETRRQVSADGKRIENVPVNPPVAAAPAPAAQPVIQPAPVIVEKHMRAATLDAAARRARASTASPAPSSSSGGGKYIVQVGAFAYEQNARLLQGQLARLGEKAFIDHTNLYHVRIGPFPTRDDAIRVRTRLENEGLSAIVITQ